MSLLVKDLMAADVLCIPSTSTVAEATQLLREHGVNGAPVVDATGKPIGVVSRTDLLSGCVQAEVERQRVYYRSASGELPGAPTNDLVPAFGQQRVSEIMMSLVFSVQKDDPVRKAAELMAIEGIHRLIVLDGTRLVGILSASDLVQAVAKGLLVPSA